MKKYETLELRAVDFKETEFIGFCDGCAIEKAAKRKWGFPYVSERIRRVVLGSRKESGVNFKHEVYDNPKFKKDSCTAASHNYDNTIIRKIKLYYE